MSQLYGRGREESYAAPNNGSGQSVYPVAKGSQPVETVSQEVIGNPGSATEPMKDYRSHVDNYGNSIIKGGWSMQPNSVDENNPRKAAELFNRVSNWRHVNRGKSSDTYDSWSNNSGGRYGYDDQGEDFKGISGWNKPSTAKHGYDQITGYAGSTDHGNNHYGGYGGHGELGDSYTGRNDPQAAQSGRSYDDQGEHMNSNHSNSEGRDYGNRGKSDDSYGWMKNDPQAQRGKTSWDYDGGREGTNQGYGYGDGVNTRRKPGSMSYTFKLYEPAYEVYGTDYNSSSRPNTARPAGTYPAVIDSVYAAKNYGGIYVPPTPSFVPRSRPVNPKHQPH